MFEAFEPKRPKIDSDPQTDEEREEIIKNVLNQVSEPDVSIVETPSIAKDKNLHPAPSDEEIVNKLNKKGSYNHGGEVMEK